MTVKFVNSWNGYEFGQVATLSGPEETRLIAAGLAVTYEPENLISASRALTAADDGRVREVAAGVALTLNGAALPDEFGMALQIPSGSVTIVSSGGTLINGATTTITLTGGAGVIKAIQQRALKANGYTVVV